MGMRTIRHWQKEAPRQSIYDQNKLREKNETEHRELAERDELDAIINLCVGSNLICHANEVLAGYERKVGIRKFARSADGLLIRARKILGKKLDAFQYQTLMANVNGADIFITTPPEVVRPKTMVCVETKYIGAIVNQCLHECAFCTRSRSDSKYCPVKQALDNIPSMNNKISNTITEDVTKCKYILAELYEND